MTRQTRSPPRARSRNNRTRLCEPDAQGAGIFEGFEAEAESAEREARTPALAFKFCTARRFGFSLPSEGAAAEDFEDG